MLLPDQSNINLFNTKRGTLFFYGGILAYVLGNLFLFKEEIYVFILFPLFLILLWMIFYQTDKVFLFILATTPFSIKKSFEDQGVSISLPTEPLLMIFLGLFIVKLVYTGRYDKRLLHHPITLIILAQLTWILITACTSSMFFVSIKFFLARLWFVVVCYFLGYEFFKKKSNIKMSIWLTCISLCCIIVYSMYRHYLNDWWQNYANYAPHPYYASHGDYAAAISLFLPFTVIFFLKYRTFQLNKWLRFLILGIFILFILGTIASYTRAAWLGILVALGVLVILQFRIKFTTLLGLLGICLVLFLGIKDQLIMSLKQNKEVSSANLTEHAESISNISTDASNTERINRWMSAFRMFNERPVFGWGPGTYMFQYAPFQNSHEMTIISTNAGNLGNAHSEYIGPLAEQGVLGGILMVALVIAIFYTSFKLIYQGKTQFIRYATLGCLLGLITYFTHGTINNYLDTDKAAVPVFSLIGLIVCLDLYYQKIEDTIEGSNSI